MRYENLSQALKRKWASGTRKPNPRSTYEKSSATLKRRYAAGEIKPAKPFTSERARAAQKLVNRDIQRAVNRRIGLMKRGRPNPSGPSAKGPGNWKARFWIVKDPDNRTRIFINLSDFIRNNYQLFLPQDVIWKGSSCRAKKGIAQLFQTNRAPPTWKQWRPLTQIELDREKDFIESETLKIRESLALSPRREREA